MSGRRPGRVAEAVRDAIATVLAREVKDPRIGLVTVTRVEMSDDLHHAKVYFSCLGDAAARQGCLVGLRSAAGFIRSHLLRRLDLRVAPQVTFIPDPSLEAADRMASLLRQIHPSEEPDGQ